MVSSFERLAEKLIDHLDGPHDDEHTARVARLAAETVRFLNYATGPHAAAGMTEPATVYTVVGNLTALAYRLVQTCDQLALWLEREHAAGRLACDTREAAAIPVEPAVDQLRYAIGRINELSAALGAAQTALGHLKRPERGDGAWM